MQSLWRLAQIFLVFAITACLSAPVYWYDMEKQLLYSFEDPGLYKFGSDVADGQNQAVKILVSR